jgi:hypothetical protein
MLRNAIAVLVVSVLVVPQLARAGGRIHEAPHRGPNVVPWFLLDGATRLGVFPRWFVSDYYPYFVYGSVYPYSVQAGFIVGCPLIKRPLLGVYGWRAHTVQVCD